MNNTALATLAVLLCAGPAMGADLAHIQSAGVLRIGTTGDYQPFAFREPDGSYRGADITMARQLAAALGVRAEFVPTTWAKLDSDFAADRFDIAVGGVSILPAREQIADFSPPTVVDGKRPIVRCADKDRFTSIASIDQPGVRVVVNPGASNEAFARSHFPHAQFTVHTDNASVFDEILAGREDVMVTDGSRWITRYCFTRSSVPPRFRRRSPGSRRHTCCPRIRPWSRTSKTGGPGRSRPAVGPARWTPPNTNRDAAHGRGGATNI